MHSLKTASISLRIEYAEDASGTYPPKLIHLLPNWHRDFKISGKSTLEQLSSAILQILDWDRNHLYEFRIGEQAYAYVGEDELFVDWDKCVSCDIPLYLLGLTPRNTFTYLYDYGSYHAFRVTVLDVQPPQVRQKLPALLSHGGKNILQYPGMMSRKNERAFKEKPAVLDALDPRRDRWRIRFIVPDDRQILMEWRESNDKTLWQKAVTVLENWNLLPEAIATKVERPLADIREWIKAFNLEQFSSQAMAWLRALAIRECTGVRMNLAAVYRRRAALAEEAEALRGAIIAEVGKKYDLDSPTETTAVLRDLSPLSEQIGRRRLTLLQMEQLAGTSNLIRSMVKYSRAQKRIRQLDAICGAAKNGRAFPIFSQVRWA